MPDSLGMRMLSAPSGPRAKSGMLSTGPVGAVTLKTSVKLLPGMPSPRPSSKLPLASVKALLALRNVTV